MEVQLVFASFTVRSCTDFAAALAQAGHPNATRYAATAKALAAQLRARTPALEPAAPWYTDYGVHAAAYLADAKLVLRQDEEEAIFKQSLSDAVTICRCLMALVALIASIEVIALIASIALAVLISVCCLC